MKALSKLLFTLAATAAFTIVQPAKANLITNPGFETGGFAPWAAGAGGAATLNVQGTVNGISPHSGNFQLVAGLPDSNSNSFVFQTFSTTPGTTYAVTFFF